MHERRRSFAPPSSAHASLEDSGENAMALTLDEIEAEALKLPEEDRAQLFSSLLLSFEESSRDAEIDQAWAEEAARRDQAMESGEEPGIPADEVFRKLRPCR